MHNLQTAVVLNVRVSMIRLIIISSIFCFLCFACSTRNVSVANYKWERENIVGLTIELIDSEKIEKYSFVNESVLMTFGRKGGFVTAPSAEWRLIDNRLVIGFFNHEGIVEPEKGSGFSLISWKGSMLTLQDNKGIVKRFRVLKSKSK